MDDLKCSKLKFHDFCEHQGWLLLFDEVNDKGSKTAYLLQNGEGIIARFDTNGEFVCLTDVTNYNISLEDAETESAQEDDE